MRSNPLETDVFYTVLSSESVAFEISLYGRDQVLFWKMIWCPLLTIYESLKGLKCSEENPFTKQKQYYNSLNAELRLLSKANGP